MVALVRRRLDGWEIGVVGCAGVTGTGCPRARLMSDRCSFEIGV